MPPPFEACNGNRGLGNLGGPRFSDVNQIRNRKIKTSFPRVNSQTRETMECARIVFVLFGLFCVGLTALIEVIRVDGDDFVSYNMNSIAWLRYIKKHTIAIEFKTVHPDGILIYIGSEHELNDFLMLDLVHGKLRYEIFGHIVYVC